MREVAKVVESTKEEVRGKAIKEVKAGKEGVVLNNELSVRVETPID